MACFTNHNFLVAIALITFVNLFIWNIRDHFLDTLASSYRTIWIKGQDTVEVEEDGFIEGYLADMWEKMQKSIDSGLKKEGVLHGELKLPRKARDFLVQARRLKDTESRTGLLASYALAVAEENGDGGFAFAPSNRSSGFRSDSRIR